MARSVEITEAELLNALAVSAGGTAPEYARTGPELQAAMGVSDKGIRRALKTFQAEGRLVVHRVRRVSLDGRNVWVPGYTITPAKAKRGR